MQETVDLSTMTKAELVDEAEALGVTVESSDTKSDLIAKIRGAEGDGAEAQSAPAPEPQLVVINPNAEVNNFNARSDDDAYLGAFVDVVGGEHQGVYGHYLQTIEWDLAGDGYPTKILVRSRDANSELLVVDYADARNSARMGGR
jgi:hypothetical protein